MKNILFAILILCTFVGCNGAIGLPAEYLNPTSISWIAPTTNTDGSEVTDGAGFRVYCGNTSGSYTLYQDVMGWQNTLYNFPVLADGDYYCVVTAYDIAGNESAYSDEASFRVDKTTPATVSNVKVNL